MRPTTSVTKMMVANRQRLERLVTPSIHSLCVLVLAAFLLLAMFTGDLVTWSSRHVDDKNRQAWIHDKRPRRQPCAPFRRPSVLQSFSPSVLQSSSPPVLQSFDHSTMLAFSPSRISARMEGQSPPPPPVYGTVTVWQQRHIPSLSASSLLYSRFLVVGY